MTVRLTNESQMIESLRDSDFDCYSAYGEVVDNSIQAGAKFCRIAVKIKEVQRQGPAFQHIEEIAFGDDGTGMDKEVLHNCLALGWSSRYNDRNGIGRFGVGMTLGAIHEAKRVEVYSKPNGGEWRHVYIDLDELKAPGAADAGIAEPKQKSPPTEYEGLVGNESGTLVIWRKYDRQVDNFSKMRPAMTTWLGRTFRKFIWSDFTIQLDGIEIKAIDPLYVTTKLTEFPNDHKAELYEPMTLNWPISQVDRRDGEAEDSTIHIRMSFLPEEFRKAKGAGGSAHAKARHIEENEGVSILRKGREVFYDHIPHWPGGAPQEIDRWWGCEIEFDPILDKAFTVKNIKRGAVPISGLRAAIHDKIKGTIATLRARVSKRFAQTEEEKIAKLREDEQETGHETAQSIAKKTLAPQNIIDRSKDFKLEVEKLIDNRYNEKSAETQAKLRELFGSQPFTITDESWDGPAFIAVAHLGGRDVINYNLRHPFMLWLYGIMERTRSGAGQPSDAEALRVGIDLLLIAFSKAEAMFDPTETCSAEVFSENLRTFWGQYLKNYLDQWQKQAGVDDA